MFLFEVYCTLYLNKILFKLTDNNSGPLLILHAESRAIIQSKLRPNALTSLHESKHWHVSLLFITASYFPNSINDTNEVMRLI